MNVRKYVVELIGTFFLVLTVGCSVLAPKDAGVVAPLAIGSALMVMIYAGGHISGGHYNPAVTLAVWIRGRCPATDVPFYMAAQVLGAALAAFAVLFLRGAPEPPAAPTDTAKIGAALLAEFLFTFALAYVVCNVATARDTANNSFLRLGHRLHGIDRDLRRRKHFGWGFQPRRRDRRRDHESDQLGERLDPPVGGFRRRGASGLRIPVP
jgi:glycerol uptake facilitator-like aquaporin